MGSATVKQGRDPREQVGKKADVVPKYATVVMGKYVLPIERCCWPILNLGEDGQWVSEAISQSSYGAD